MGKSLANSYRNGGQKLSKMAPKDQSCMRKREKKKRYIGGNCRVIREEEKEKKPCNVSSIFQLTLHVALYQLTCKIDVM